MDKKNPDELIVFGELSPFTKEEYDRLKQPFDPVADLAAIFGRSREAMERGIANAIPITPIDFDQFVRDLLAVLKKIDFMADDQGKARQRSKANVKRQRKIQRGGNPHHIGRPE